MELMIPATSISTVLMFDICGICSSECGMEYHRVNFPNYPDVHAILFGIENMNDGHEVLNFCILHIKYYVYTQRLFHDNTLSIRAICNEIRYKLDIKRKIYENDDKQINFGKYVALYDVLISL